MKSTYFRKIYLRPLHINTHLSPCFIIKDMRKAFHINIYSFALTPGSPADPICSVSPRLFAI